VAAAVLVGLAGAETATCHRARHRCPGTGLSSCRTKAIEQQLGFLGFSTPVAALSAGAFENPAEPAKGGLQESGSSDSPRAHRLQRGIAVASTSGVLQPVQRAGHRADAAAIVAVEIKNHGKQGHG